MCAADDRDSRTSTGGAAPVSARRTRAIGKQGLHHPVSSGRRHASRYLYLHLFHVSRWLVPRSCSRPTLRLGTARTEVEESEEDDDIAKMAGTWHRQHRLPCSSRHRFWGRRPPCAIPATAPSLTLSRTTLPAGGALTFVGTGFAARQLVTVSVLSKEVVLGRYRATRTGVVTGKVTIPRRTVLGGHTFKLTARHPNLSSAFRQHQRAGQARSARQPTRRLGEPPSPPGPRGNRQRKGPGTGRHRGGADRGGRGHDAGRAPSPQFMTTGSGTAEPRRPAPAEAPSACAGPATPARGHRAAVAYSGTPCWPPRRSPWPAPSMVSPGCSPVRS